MQQGSGPAAGRTTVALGAAIVVVLIAGVVGAFAADDAGDVDDTVEVASPETSSTTTTTASTGTSGATDATSDDTTGAPTTAAPTDTAAPTTGTTADEGLGEPQDPGPVSAPAAGTYRYRVRTDGTESETSTRVSDISRDGDSAVVEMDQTIQGIQARNRVDWNPDRALLRASTLTIEGTEISCDWRPDSLEGAFPLSVGRTWTVDSSCTAKYNGIDVDITRRSSTEIVALERRTIAGEVLDLWVGESTEEISVKAALLVDETAEAQTRTWFSPPHGMMVRTEGTTSGDMGGQGGGSYESEILNLTPA